MPDGFKLTLEAKIAEHQKDCLIGFCQTESFNPTPIEVAPLLQAGLIIYEGSRDNDAGKTLYLYQATDEGKRLYFNSGWNLIKRDRFEYRK